MIFAYDQCLQIEERKKVSCNFWPVWVSLQNLHICWVENVVLCLNKWKKSFLPGRGEEKSFLNSWSASAGGGTWFGVEFGASAKIGRLEGSGRESGKKR